MFDKLKNLFTRKDEDKKLQRSVFGVMLLGGVAALIAAFTLTLEKFHLYEDPGAVLPCSINVVLNCSTVMQTWQSSVFGFPNMIIGLMAFSVVITIAVAGLGGVKFPRWFLIAAQVGYLGGLTFAYWLFFQSVYAIQVLCPWCLLVTTSTTLIFAAMTHYNLKQNTFGFSKKINEPIQRFLKGGYHQMLVAAWLALMVTLVLLKFGEGLFA
jgi:uncharacterized membrane protein